MQVIADLKAYTITSIVKKDVSVDSELITDHSTSYVKLKDVVDKHDAQVIPKEKIRSVLPWVHIAITMQNGCCWIYITILSLNICRTTSMNFATTSIEDISAKLYSTDCSLLQYRIKISLGTVKDIH